MIRRLRKPRRLERGRPRARLFAILVVALLVAPVPVFLLLASIPLPPTPLMGIRWLEGYAPSRDLVPLTAISPHLVRAVIAAEDGKFCTHAGFDWAAIDKALDALDDGRKVRGASTISQQTVKNLLLWPGRDWLRKGLEAVLTVYIELLWSKRQIMAAYLNIIEWGPGIYGAEAAAQYWFKLPAKSLSPTQAARLAAILPDPLDWKANPPGAYVARRAGMIEGRAAAGGGPADCIGL